MIETNELDAHARYAELRRENGLPPHDQYEPRDLELLDFYLAGVVAGTRNTLMRIKEHRTA